MAKVNSDKAKVLLDEIEQKQRAILNIKDELDWLSGAPIPPESLRERVKAHVDNMAQAFISTAPMMSIQAPGSGIEATRNFLNYGISDVGFGRPLLSEFICFVLGDTVVEKICAAIEANGLVCGPALPNRKLSIEKLKRELFNLECLEESLICQAEALGLTIARRDDADPAAVLDYDASGSMPLLRIGYAGGSSIGVTADRQPMTPAIQNVP